MLESGDDPDKISDVDIKERENTLKEKVKVILLDINMLQQKSIIDPQSAQSMRDYIQKNETDDIAVSEALKAVEKLKGKVNESGGKGKQ